MQKILFLLIAVLNLFPVHAQYEEKDFVQYTVRDGLSENYITSLIQDERGYLWIGTDIGLNRFDGHAFKKFFQGTKTLPLLSSTITKLKSFGQRQLGIINRGGLQVLNTNDLSIRNYSIPDTTAFSVYRNAAWDAVEMPNKSYAVTTASGFYIFDASGKLSFRHDEYQLKDIGQKRILYGRDIFSLGKEEYMVFIKGEALAFFNPEKKSFYEIQKEEKKWVPFYPLASQNNIAWTSRWQLSRNEFVFIPWANNTVEYYDHATNKIIVSSLEVSPLEFNWESKPVMVNDSTFLVNGAQSGFYLFHINMITGKIRSNSKKFLAGLKIQCLYLDKDNRLWVGTSKGLLQQKMVKQAIQSYLYRPSPSDTLTGGLSCAYRYKDKLYLGRLSLYKGLVIADAINKKMIRQIEFYGKYNAWNEIFSIEMYHPDTLWIGTNAGLLWFDTKSMNYGKLFTEKNAVPNLSDLNILAAPRNDGFAWMCGFLKGVVARYHINSRSFTVFTSNTNPALPFDRVKSIAYDAYGDVWIGGHSLTRWNTQKQLFDTLISVYSGPNKYEDNILAIAADNGGSLWFHNALNGLLEYRIKEKKYVHYSIKDGLPSDVLYGFSPVINNHLWIVSNNQLTDFNILTKKVTVFDHLDGFPNDKPTARKLYYDSSDTTLYLLNEHTLAIKSLTESSIPDYSNDLVIEELILNNKIHHFYPTTNLRLRPNQNNLSLQFGIIDFESGNKYQFAYKLKETESWTDIGEQRNVNLTGLAPGSYTIWLKATGKTGLQKTKDYSFVISPPFWKTTWFFVTVFLVLVSLIYLIYRYRIRQIRQIANIDKQLSQAELKALHAQMNPHFVFNSLNSIREMILANENEEASHFLSKFAHLIRITLDQSGQSFISLRNSIEYLTRYIEMEQIRNNQFTCRILADDELDPDETVLPPMLIQPFVENAIWHGAIDEQKSINIQIDFKKKGTQLVCIIEDNGIGINQSLKNKSNTKEEHHSVGIVNIQNRMRLLNEKYHLQCSLKIEDKSEVTGYNGTGTVVTLLIPLEIMDE